MTINGKITLKLNEGEENEKTFIGAMSTTFPTAGSLDIRPSLGNSIEFICYMEFAYVQYAINSSDVSIYFGNDAKPIPYTQYSMSRKNTLTANLYSNSKNEQAQTYAESSVFGLDLSMPAVTSDWDIGQAVAKFLRGKSNANTPFDLRIVDPYKEESDEETVKLKVIFGDVIEGGRGTENVTWQISFVPYLECEEEEV